MSRRSELELESVFKLEAGLCKVGPQRQDG
jgi:hypothetical protein